MKSLQVKIQFDRESSNDVSTKVLQSLPGQYITERIYSSILIVLFILTLTGCKESGKTSNPVSVNFPVNQSIAANLIAKGVPADAANFFASAKVETSYPDDTTIICNQTFPNGATRDITIKIDPNRQYTPTANEIANTAHDSIPIYGFQFSSKISPDSSTETIAMNYFVAKATLPKLSGNVHSPAGSVKSPLPNVLQRIASLTGGNMSFGVNWLEVGNKGQDVAISSVIEYASEHGNPTGPLGSIYQLASALSDVSSAMDVSNQVSAWLAQLKALLDCAANPTNQVARSDPNYIRDATNKIESAESELKTVSAVRFLNIMTETAAQLTPVTNVLSVGMKQGFVYSEQTLSDYSLNTIMREAESAVVPCSTSTFAGNIDVLDDCTQHLVDIVHTVTHVQTQVSWVYLPSKGWYTPIGTYTYSQTITITPTSGGSGCTQKRTAIGHIDGTGTLIVAPNAMAAQVWGYDYSAAGSLNDSVAASFTCPVYSQIQSYDITWLPAITGHSTNGYDGSQVTSICGGGGTETVTWSFSVPPK